MKGEKWHRVQDAGFVAQGAGGGGPVRVVGEPRAGGPRGGPPRSGNKSALWGAERRARVTAGRAAGGHGRAEIDRGVAAGAARQGMPAAEREAGLVVVEADASPVIGRMAAGAAGALQAVARDQLRPLLRAARGAGRGDDA